MSSVLTEKANITAEVTEKAKPTIGKLPLSISLGIVIAVSVVFGSYHYYLHNFGFSFGLDYFEPEFQTYWMSLFYIQLPVLIFIGISGSLYLWMTRDKFKEMTPEEELKVYMRVLAFLLAFGMSFGIVFALCTEADAAWHQVTIRDTDFTPTHILLFYFLVPLMITALVLAFLWLHTRLPDFRNRVSLSLGILVAGVAMIMPNVGFNEWGHTFFYAEELFAAPIHWGFVGLGWAFFAISGLLIQVLDRLKKLTAMKKGQAVTVSY